MLIAPTSRIARRGSLRSITTALLAGTALTMVVVTTASIPARADGGAGGADGAAGGTGFAGNPGTNAGFGGGGGGGGAGGGAGGAGDNGAVAGGAGGTDSTPANRDGQAGTDNPGTLNGGGGGGGGGFNGNGAGASGLSNPNLGTLIGGIGGAGGSGYGAIAQGGGGGGGAGGFGAVITGSSGNSTNFGTILGGTGGEGGQSQGSPGNGGDGGVGVQFSTSGAALTTSGAITGGNGGVGGASIFNAIGAAGQGGAGGVGIAGNGITITNLATGAITGGNGGNAGTSGAFASPAVGGDGAAGIIGSDLTIINSGTIAGGAGGIGTNGGATGAAGAAIALTGGFNMVTNSASGNIVGAAGVISTSGVTIIDNAGSITGGSLAGAIAAEFLTLTNSGTLSAAPGINSVVFALSDTSITNTAGASISGGAYGLSLLGTSVVSTAGLITSTNAAIFGGGDLTVINAATGMIAGGDYGIQSCSCTLLTVVNAGSITGTSTAAISASTVDITNTGTISSDNGAGIEATNGGVITNGPGATISGFTYGISASNGSVTVLNSGMISADLNAFGSRAISSAQDISLTNDATGVINGNDGVRAEGSVNVVNAGSITARGYAIRAGSGGSSVFNSGTISGGGGEGGTIAILFSGGSNTLTLAPGSSITGLVLGTGNDAFVLAGATGTGTLDVSRIGGTAQYRGFGSFTKSDGSTWVLTGTPQQATSWNINGGTLSVSSNANLGNANEAVSINSGILQVTGTTFTSTPRTINWGASGGGFDIAAANNTFTISQVIGPGGPLQKLGAGTLVLTAANTYTGDTTVSAGTLQLGSGGTTGSITGNVINNATLAFNRSDAVTFGGAISGTGAVQHIGAGTTTLTAVNTYTGPTTVSAGTLVIAAGASITSNVGNAATFINNGTVNGSLANTGTLTNAGSLMGAVTNTNGGTVTTTGLISGGLTNIGIGGLAGASSVVANGGAINGTIVNSGGVFYVQGNVTGNGTFQNTNAGTVSVSGSFTGLTTVTNDGGNGFNSLSIAGGGTLSANAIINNGFLSNSGTLTSLTAPVMNNAGGGFSNASGGTVNGGLVNAGQVNANGGAINGAIVNAAGGTFNVSGAVTSNSTFGNANGATLAVTGFGQGGGTYTLQGLLTNAGAVSVAAGGTLVATAGGITNTATGVITNNGTIRDDLNNAGVVSNNGLYVANVATNTGRINNTGTGTWTGNVASNAAAISNAGTWTGNVLANTGTLINSNIWTGSIATSGSFANVAGASVSGSVTNAGTLTNAGALNGGLVNTAGVATNSGSIAGLTTLSGGTLTGAGSVANLTVTGGTFAPGNGTPGSSMTVTGNLVLGTAATYLVQVSPTAASFAAVKGNATLNGSAAAVYLAGNYVSSRYTILNAAGGVSGAFSSLVNTNLPQSVSASLSYDAFNAYLDLKLNFIVPGGLNVNQQNVATSLGNYFTRNNGIPIVFGTLTPSGLTQASGEGAVGTQQATFDAMGLFMGLLTDPFVSGRGDGGAVSAGAVPFAEESESLAYAANGKRRSTAAERDAYAAIYRKASPLAADSFGQRWSIWAAGYGGSQTTDGNAALGSNAATSRVYGTAVGLDYRVSPYTLAGIALAGGGTNYSIANGLGSGRSDLFQIGGFVRHTVGPTYITAALAYGWQDVTTDRTVTIAGVDMLRGRFTTNAFSGRVEGGYRTTAPVFGGIGVTPYAAGQFTTYSLPNYGEQVVAGANTFALNYAARDVTASRSELGLRSDKSFAVQDGILTLRGRAAWAHNFNPDRSINATFQTLPGASFVVNGAAQARDAALVTASAEMKWRNNWSAAATFEGEFSDVTRSVAGKGVVRYAW